jgi:hypothetical protein
MRVAKWISGLGVLAMTLILIYGFTVGNFTEDGGEILQNPWGLVSMVDLYVGFILFSGWIAYREESIIKTIIWILFMMVLGFFTGSLYTFLALMNSSGDWKKFWMGKHSE